MNNERKLLYLIYYYMYMYLIFSKKGKHYSEHLHLKNVIDPIVKFTH